MRNKLLFSLFAYCVSANAATHLQVFGIEERPSSFELEKIQAIDFRDNQTYKIIGADGNIQFQSDYNKTRSLVFAEPTKSKAERQTNLQVYPNPTQDGLHLTGIPANTKVAILNNNGKQVYANLSATEELDIDVQNLPNGTYLLLVANKTIKFIKQ